MSAICGTINLSDKGLLKEMITTMNYRGNDGTAYLISDGFSFAHGLLKNKLESNPKPLVNEDHSIFAVADARIYNYKKLMEKLEEDHIFDSVSDKEVIVHLYEEYGEDFFKHIEGIFAIALYDTKEKKLILARDPMGIKPLFWFMDNEFLFFASQIKSFLMYEDFPFKVNREVLEDYLSYGYSNDLRTPIHPIKRVPQGYYIVYKNNKLELRRFVDIDIQTLDKSEDYFAKQIRRNLENSIKRRIDTGIDLGILLSGGIDSTTIVALMKNFGYDNIKTFSLGFSNSEDELEYSRYVAEYFGTDHTELVLDPEKVGKAIKDIIWKVDEPIADIAIVPTYFLSKLAAEKNVKLGFVGEGNDELYGGAYLRYLTHNKYRNLRKKIPQVLYKSIIPRMLFLIPKSETSYRIEYACRLMQNPASYLQFQKNFTAPERMKLLIPSGNPKIDDNNAENHFFTHIFNDKDFISAMMLSDAFRALPNQLLIKDERMLMANGVECDAPLIDFELVRFSAKIPLKYKLNKGQEKYIFHQAVKDIVPSRILNRKKRGFGAGNPSRAWALDNYEFLQQEFENSKILKIINKKYLYKFMDNAFRGDFKDLKFWSIANLAIWLNTLEEKMGVDLREFL